MNSTKFIVSLLAKHWTYQTPHECINAAVNVVILPIKNYKFGFNIQLADVADIKFFVIFFRRKERADRQTAIRVIKSNSKLPL